MEWGHLIVLTKALLKQLLREMNALEASVQMGRKQLTVKTEHCSIEYTCESILSNRELGRSSPY